ncbi:MAG: inorganic diphosphatase [Actinomycetota bacterium]|nr:inorganic diphosphatase [Actinomycetota bacterium]
MAEQPLTCFIEIPKGSRNKYEYDKELGRIKLDRLLFSSIVFPTDYGFVVDTCAEDGDPLDALVCVTEATFPGCVIEAKPVALFKMADEEGPDDKVVCVPVDDPGWAMVEGLEDLDSAMRNEISHFFSIYKELEGGKEVSIEGWYSREDAVRMVEEARERYRDGQREGA